MTVHPETRFTCDRCKVDEIMPTQNTPVHTRTAGPAGWLSLQIGSEPGMPLSHLCSDCAAMFKILLNSAR